MALAESIHSFVPVAIALYICPNDDASILCTNDDGQLHGSSDSDIFSNQYIDGGR